MRINGTLTGDRYLADILQAVVHPFIQGRADRDNIVFQQGTIQTLHRYTFEIIRHLTSTVITTP